MANTTLPTTIDFDGVSIEVIDHDGSPWLTLQQIAVALGYEQPRSLVDIHRRNRAEFTPDMTALLRQGRTRVRIFSPRGAHLIGMFARTPKAKAFRRWVLDVLDGLGHPQLPPTGQAAQALPAPADPITPEVRSAINRRAHALSLRHYDRLREDLLEAVRRHAERFPEDCDLVRFAEQVDTHDSSLTVVRSEDLLRLTTRLSLLEPIYADAMAAIHALEQATGRQWYGRSPS